MTSVNGKFRFVCIIGVMLPLAALSVGALSVNSADEQAAAFCLRLLGASSSYSNVVERRVVKLFTEKLSYNPVESASSRRGYALADTFLNASNDPAEISMRLAQCYEDLSKITAGYSWHSCGYAQGSLSESWSEKDLTEFAAYVNALEVVRD